MVSRHAIPPPESDRLTDADIDRMARVRLERTSPPTSTPDPFRAAADAVTQLAQTLAACAREVETREGKRVARRARAMDIQATHVALVGAMMALHGDVNTPDAKEIAEMIEGCSFGYVREAWAARIVQMGAEVVRDTEPEAEASHG